jgi:peptide-methionine (S)-S-oxide reductase
LAQEQAILAGGCFWCTEAVFKDLTGVTSVESGYIGGHVDNPTYRQVCGGDTGHAEAIRVTFDPALIGYDDILDIFFATHDPTQLNRQGNDVGTQYRSAIFPASAEQEEAARRGIERAAADWPSPIVTTIEPLGIAATGPSPGRTQESPIAAIGPSPGRAQESLQWWPAEDYHQDYWEGEGQSSPYCLAVIPPKLQKLRKRFAARLKDQAPAG